MDLSVSCPTIADAEGGTPTLLVVAAARAAITPTALAQARLPACVDPFEAAFDRAVAATIAAATTERTE